MRIMVGYSYHLSPAAGPAGNGLKASITASSVRKAYHADRRPDDDTDIFGGSGFHVQGRHACGSLRGKGEQVGPEVGLLILDAELGP